MTEHIIVAAGCDDETRITIDLSDIELAVATKLADALTAASEYHCQPKLIIDPIDEDTE